MTNAQTPVEGLIVQFIKTHKDAQLPLQNHSTDSGLDLFAVEDALIEFGKPVVVNVGLQLAHITPGYWFRIEARSGLGFKHGIVPHFGIIDNGYRGDLAVKLYRIQEGFHQIKKGDRIAQIVFYPIITPCKVDFVDQIVDHTERGEKGIGSSDV